MPASAGRSSQVAAPYDAPGADRGIVLADAAMAGDRRALARLLTEVENHTPDAESGLRRLYGRAGRAHLVGITGAPGAGKSTLVAALIGQIRATGRSVAVIAVDPSSPITGGALLGDRVRMQAYAGFIPAVWKFVVFHECFRLRRFRHAASGLPASWYAVITKTPSRS